MDDSTNATRSHAESEDWEAAVSAAAEMISDSTEPIFKTSEHTDQEEAGAVLLSIDEVSYDRDVKWVNVPVRQAKCGSDSSRIRHNHGLVRQINSITSGNRKELSSLDEHYRDLDKRKAIYECSQEKKRGSSARKRKGGSKQARQQEPSALSGPADLAPAAGQVQLLSRPPVCSSEPTLRADAPSFVPSWEK